MAFPPEHAFLAEYADRANVGGLFSVKKSVKCSEQPTSDSSCAWIGDRVRLEPLELHFGAGTASAYHAPAGFYEALRTYTGSDDVRAYFILKASPVALDASVPGTVCGLTKDETFVWEDDSNPLVVSPNGRVAVFSGCIASQARSIGDAGVDDEGRTLRDLVEGNEWCTLPVSVVEGDLEASAARVPTRGGLDPTGTLCR
ncbi:MAG: hypothetical protein HY904_17040 [Deltaproteobacteria bacterium]|nr:hypothetical protein [Deltaproteobacteria bacterium]